MYSTHVLDLLCMTFVEGQHADKPFYVLRTLVSQAFEALDNIFVSNP